jgi:hypothetical protein
MRERGNARCRVNRAMHRELPALFDAADAAVGDTLRRTRISTLVQRID